MRITRAALACVALIGVLASAETAYGCSFDTDCAVGSKCIKQRGALYGVCLAGLSPGNTNDRRPVYSPLDPNRTYGNTCSFDTDCGPGSACVKESGAIRGACLKRQIAPVSPESTKASAGKKASGCSFNTDCPIGAKCLKESGQLEGVCVK